MYDETDATLVQWQNHPPTLDDNLATCKSIEKTEIINGEAELNESDVEPVNPPVPPTIET